ncbi:metalloprotease, putative [Entamoeba dispar SAW760]|uniref:Metalloprotease, putative n=1 Tax=Entamoeba dispar (strain ATCC PRA-260 / SAW760) TaxID=370354 RepID=B0EIA4_ENTDS|nr:metalloprotease, putative [Entamoeba dispar SAW760]EDR25752.1 metalloprotease, putative [Entamoeba dispar SAW760]|eukprot:EDR25752.1 metalloprotease, putative [Entamoeba dispar SAW760]
MIPLHSLQYVQFNKGFNGLLINTPSNNNSIVVSTVFGVGSVHDNIYGAAHFLEHIILRGNNQFNSEELRKMNNKQLLNISAITSREITKFQCITNPLYWKRDITTIMSLLFQPSFNNKQIIKENTIINSERQYVKMDKTQQLFQKKHELLFGNNTPFGHEIIGSEYSQKQIQILELQRMYNKYYYSNNCCIGVLCPYQYQNQLINFINKNISQFYHKQDSKNQCFKYTHINQYKKPNIISKDGCCIATKGSFRNRLITDLINYKVSLNQESYHIPYYHYNLIISSSPLDLKNIQINSSLKENYLNKVKVIFNNNPILLLDYYLTFDKFHYIYLKKL